MIVRYIYICLLSGERRSQLQENINYISDRDYNDA